MFSFKNKIKQNGQKKNIHLHLSLKRIQIQIRIIRVFISNLTIFPHFLTKKSFFFLF
jgi:hypothetical protein